MIKHAFLLVTSVLTFVACTGAPGDEPSESAGGEIAIAPAPPEEVCKAGNTCSSHRTVDSCLGETG